MRPGRLSGTQYDLVVCLYVHVPGSVEEMVRRMATGVAHGGTLFLVGHRPIDPATGAATAAAGQVQVSVEAALAALDPDRWELVVAADRPRPVGGYRRRCRDPSATPLLTRERLSGKPSRRARRMSGACAEEALVICGPTSVRCVAGHTGLMCVRTTRCARRAFDQLISSEALGC